MNIILFLIFLVLFVLAFLCSFGVYSSVGGFLKAYRAKNWPICEGKIVKSEKKDIHFEGSEISIEFSYQVNGQEYVSNTPYYGPRNLVSSKQLKWFLDQFSLGSWVKVYYDPENPSDSTLVVGINKLQYQALGAIVYICSLATFFAVFAILCGMMSFGII